MKKFIKISVIFLGVMFCLQIFAQTADDKKSLQGLWQAKSINKDGKDVSQDATKSLQLVFKEDKLTIKGNSGKDSTQECAYKIDSTKSPKHLDIFLQTSPILAIYELNNDELKICFKYTPPPSERPSSCEAGANMSIIVYKKQKT